MDKQVRQGNPVLKCDEANPYDRMSKIMMLAVVITIFGVFGIGFWHEQMVFNEDQATILTWPRDRVLANPENLKRFIEARLNYLAEQIPADVIHPNYAPDSVSTVIRKFLTSEELNIALREIILARNKTTNDASLSLTFLGDLHYNPLFDIQSPASAQRQRWIATTIHQASTNLLFVEGVNGQLTWESQFQAERDDCQRQNIPGPQSIEQYRSVTLLHSKVWWTEFMDNPKFFLYGCDRPHMGRLGMLMNSLRLTNPALIPIWQDTFNLLIKTYREQTIMARCVLILRERHATQAYLVLGDGHTASFSALCQTWGVKIQVIEPPQ